MTHGFNVLSGCIRSLWIVLEAGFIEVKHTWEKKIFHIKEAQNGEIKKKKFRKKKIITTGHQWNTNVLVSSAKILLFYGWPETCKVNPDFMIKKLTYFITSYFVQICLRF